MCNLVVTVFRRVNTTGIHFTKGLRALNWHLWKIPFSLILLLIVQPSYNFAHVTTAELQYMYFITRLALRTHKLILCGMGPKRQARDLVLTTVSDLQVRARMKCLAPWSVSTNKQSQLTTFVPKWHLVRKIIARFECKQIEFVIRDCKQANNVVRYS